MTNPEATDKSTASRNQGEDPNTKDLNPLAQQDVQPESGALSSQEEKQMKRRHSMGTERVKHAKGEATEEA